MARSWRTERPHEPIRSVRGVAPDPVSVATDASGTRVAIEMTGEHVAIEMTGEHVAIDEGAGA